MNSPTTFTHLGFQLVHAIDEGEVLPIGDTSTAIENGDVIQWLAQQLPFPRIDVSLFVSNGDDAQINQLFQDIHIAYGPSKFGTTSNGLNYLLALALQSIQQLNP